MSLVPRPLALVLAALACAGAGVMLIGSPAGAHADFIGSDPREGARLDVVPRELQLEFSDELEPGLSTVTLQVEGGDSTTLDLHSGANRNVLLAAVPTSLDLVGGTASAWRVTFRVVSRDGHPVTGTIQFIVRNATSADVGDDPTSSEIKAGGPSNPMPSASRETWPLVAVAVGVLMLLTLAAGTVMRLVRRGSDT